MDSKDITPEKTSAVAVESTETQTFTDALSVMKEQNESEAQRIVAATASKGKPQTLAEACLVMKDENIEEAHRLVPDRANNAKVTET